MRLKNSKEIAAFEKAIAASKGEVWLETPEGDRLNLKSLYCKYIAIDRLLEDKGNELELYCQFKEDERFFFSNNTSLKDLENT